MTPEEINKVKRLLWRLSSERTADAETIKEVVAVMRRLLNSYQGAVKKMYKLRDRLRKESDE